MKALWVLFDAQCSFCVRCAGWLSLQPTFLPIHCLPAGSPEVLQRFPGLRDVAPREEQAEELTVVDDEGGVYLGTDAWLMTLWALVELRPWAARLASPQLAPLARRMFAALSSGRHVLSAWMGRPDAALVEAVTRSAPAETMACELPAGVQGQCPSCLSAVPSGRRFCGRCLGEVLAVG